MARGEIKSFGATLEAAFPKAVIFKPTLFEETIDGLTEAIGFQIPPESIRVRQSDVLYGYELRASFFGADATLTRTAEKLVLSLANGQSQEDAKLILQVVTKFGQRFFTGLAVSPTLTIAVHFEHGSSDEVHQFSDRFAPSAALESCGASGYVRRPGVRTPARIMIEPSFSYPGSLVASLWIRMDSGEAWAMSVEGAAEALEAAVRVYGGQVVF